MSLVRLAVLLILPASLVAQFRPIDDPPPVDAATQQAAIRALGNAAFVIRYGHLSASDQTEAIAILDTGSANFYRDGKITRLVVLRKVGDAWSPDLTVDKVVRNPQGFVGATAIDQVRRSDLYEVKLFNRVLDDGKNYFIIQLTPVDADGKSSAPSIYVSWNPLVGRYQQISLEGYGFSPELHEPCPRSRSNSKSLCQEIDDAQNRSHTRATCAGPPRALTIAIGNRHDSETNSPLDADQHQ